MNYPSGSSRYHSYEYEEQEELDQVEDEELLNFDTAMEDFRHMFPNLSPYQIEDVLKKYDGDVSATINELLFDTNNQNSATISVRTQEDRLTTLRRQKIDIQKKLDEYQRLLDKVVDVETARVYEDQQLACLLQYREISEQIKAEKEKHAKMPRLSPEKIYRQRKSAEKEKERSKEKLRPSPVISKSQNRSFSKSFDDIRPRCPDGPYVEQMTKTTSSSDLKTKLSSFKKASASRLSRLFSAS